MKLKLLFMVLFSVSLSFANASETPVKSSVVNVSKNPVVLGQNYPNPAKGRTVINVEFSGGEAVLSIYNVLGKLVEEIVISSEKKTITLDVSDYQEGIYLYSIEADGQKVTKRMTVSK
jgi:hypothetical protein